MFVVSTISKIGQNCHCDLLLLLFLCILTTDKYSFSYVVYLSEAFQSLRSVYSPVRIGKRCSLIRPFQNYPICLILGKQIPEINRYNVDNVAQLQFFTKSPYIYLNHVDFKIFDINFLHDIIVFLHDFCIFMDVINFVV